MARKPARRVSESAMSVIRSALWSGGCTDVASEPLAPRILSHRLRKRRWSPTGARDLGVRRDAQSVVGVELDEECPAARGFVVFAERRGGGEECMKSAKETAIGRLRPANQAVPAPPLATQSVEPAVVRHARERIGRHP